MRIEKSGQPGHGRHAQRRRRPPASCCLVHVMFLWCVALVGVPVANAGMCECGPACCACCGVLQRRHNFDAFLHRFGKRQSQVLVRHWHGTATRNSSSDDGLCGHLCVL